MAQPRSRVEIGLERAYAAALEELGTPNGRACGLPVRTGRRNGSLPFAAPQALARHVRTKGGSAGQDTAGAAR